MSVETFSIHDIVVQSEGYLVSDMNGEKVMLSIENGKYYNLGQVGGRIWELLAAPTTVAAMIEALKDEYSIEQEACEREVQAFLQKLAGEGLIRITRE